MTNSKLQQLTTSPLRGIFMAAAAGILIIQGIYYSHSTGLFLTIVLATVLLFYLLPKHRDQLLFYLIPLGPLINLTALYRDEYLYNMEVVILTFFFLWFLYNTRKIDVVAPGQAFSWYRFFFVLVFITTLIRILLYQNSIGEIRLVRAYFIGYFFLLFLNRPRLDATTSYSRFYRGMALSLGLISVIGLIGYLYRILFTGNWQGEPGSVFSSSETLAIFLILALPMVFGGKEQATTSGSRIWIYLSLIAGFLLLLATRSRAGLIGIFIVTLLFFALRYNQLNRRSQLIGLLALVLISIAALGVVLMKTFPMGRLGDLPTARILEQTSFSRIEEWKVGLHLIWQSPIFGNGPVGNVYNLYLQLSAQFGLVVFLTFFMFLFYSLQPFFLNLQKISLQPRYLGLFLGTIGFLFASIFESTIGNQIGYFVWFYLLFLSVMPETTSS